MSVGERECIYRSCCFIQRVSSQESVLVWFKVLPQKQIAIGQSHILLGNHLSLSLSLSLTHSLTHASAKKHTHTHSHAFGHTLFLSVSVEAEHRIMALNDCYTGDKSSKFRSPNFFSLSLSSKSQQQRNSNSSFFSIESSTKPTSVRCCRCCCC